MRYQLELWKKESLRRTAVAYCTAFEIFLKNLLIDLLVLYPYRIHVYAKKEFGFNLTINDLIGKEKVDWFVTNAQPQFSGINRNGNIKKIYQKLLGLNIFNDNTSSIINNKNITK
jgi:hypothetical protein